MRDQTLGDEILKDIDRLTPEELKYLKSAISDEDKMNNLWYSDYEEIPVDIETFMTDPEYLGKSLINDEGKSLIYPFWHNELQKIWAPNSGIWELALSGSIGSGKSTQAVICMAYMLYRLLCLRDPTKYYNLTKGSKIAIAFFNLNLDQAYGVGWTKLQGYLKNSPWFLRHGSLVGRGDNLTYYPEKDINIVVGSQLSHFIGRDIFCLTGDTIIETENGCATIESLQDYPVRVLNSNGELSDQSVCSCLMGFTKDLIEIQLEDDTIIRCTPNHRFMLKDGSWKQAMDLTEDDELMEISKI